jgi:ribonuclease HI
MTNRYWMQLEAKKLAGCKHKNAEHIESALASEQIDLIPDYIAYTDGSCNNLSPYGEGGAAYIILDRHDNIIVQNSKGFVGTTNNRMEMLAIISVINWLPNGTSVEIRTDSQYCIDMLSCPKCPKKIKKNSDLVEKFYRIRERKGKVIFTWVKGHNGTEYNELADALAESRTEEMRALHNIPIYNYQNSPKCANRRKMERKKAV